MALLEVVLLAGPAFAVIARRTPALAGADGRQRRHPAAGAQGRARQRPRARWRRGRRSVSGWGWWSPGSSLPVVQRFSDNYLGPYDVPWLHLLGIAGFGLLSALLAAVVPAWLASRQDVVAVLGRPARRPPAVAALAAARAAAARRRHRAGGVRRRPRSGRVSTVIAVSAIVAVLGMILLVPVVVVAARPAGAAAAAAAAVRRARRGAPPHPHRAGRRRGRRHRGRRGRARHRQRQRRRARADATYTPLLADGQASGRAPPAASDGGRVSRRSSSATCRTPRSPRCCGRAAAACATTPTSTSAVRRRATTSCPATAACCRASRSARTATVPAHVTGPRRGRARARPSRRSPTAARWSSPTRASRADEVTLVARVRRAPPVGACRADHGAGRLRSSAPGRGPGAGRAVGARPRRPSASTPVTVGLLVAGAEITRGPGAGRRRGAAGPRRRGCRCTSSAATRTTTRP